MWKSLTNSRSSLEQRRSSIATIARIGCAGVRRAVLLLALALMPMLLQAQLSFFTDTTERGCTKRLWVASHLLPGYGQISNRQLWKLPIYYGGMGGLVYSGIKQNELYLSSLDAYALSGLESDQESYTQHRLLRNMSFVAAGVVYAAGIADALVVRNREVHSPTTATVLSVLLPGAGQIYNRRYFKLPFIYGGGAALFYGMSWNGKMYTRFREALVASSNGDEVPAWARNRNTSNLEHYTNMYRRNRDLCVLGFVLLYVANVLDANVDAHLYTWDVNDDLSMRLAPAQLDLGPGGGTAWGLALNINL